MEFSDFFKNLENTDLVNSIRDLYNVGEDNLDAVADKVEDMNAVTERVETLLEMSNELFSAYNSLVDENTKIKATNVKLMYQATHNNESDESEEEKEEEKLNALDQSLSDVNIYE